MKKAQYTGILAMTFFLTTGCGESGNSTDPSAGVETPAPAEAAGNVKPNSVNITIAQSLPVTIGSQTYTSEVAIIPGLTSQVRDLLFRAGKANWQVTPTPTSVDLMLAEEQVTIEIHPVADASNTMTATREQGTPRAWSVEAATIDETTEWRTSVSVKVPLANAAGIETHCALLEFLKDMTPSTTDAFKIGELGLAISEGPCSSGNSTRVTSLSAKSKIAPGDDKQSVAVVMGTAGMTVLSPTLWKWADYPPYKQAPCDCQIQFDANGKVTSQTGVPAGLLDVTKW